MTNKIDSTFKFKTHLSKPDKIKSSKKSHKIKNFSFAANANMLKTFRGLGEHQKQLKKSNRGQMPSPTAKNSVKMPTVKSLKDHSMFMTQPSPRNSRTFDVLKAK